MADADDKGQPQAEGGGKKSLVARLLPWIVIVIIVGVSAGAGLGLGRLFAGSRGGGSAGSGPAQDKAADTTDLETTANSSGGSENVWYYDLDPVVANLNEPSVTRYVSASLTPSSMRRNPS